MNIAFVVQRYGAEIVGGAESHAKNLAEHLSKDLQWNVSVFTTTAQDYDSWKPHFRAGMERINGVEVKRFHASGLRSRWFTLYKRLFKFILCPLFRRTPLIEGMESLWLRLQGPFVPELVTELRNTAYRYDAIIFMTYLYFPTIEGAAMLRGQKPYILIPTAHDEPPFYFRKVGRLLNEATLIFANTNAEIALIQRVHPEVKPKLKVVGAGVELRSPLRALSNTTIPSGPYLLYLGRLGPAKGVDLLIKYFIEFKSENPGDATKLLLCGAHDRRFTAPSHPDIEDRGFVGEDDKLQLLLGAKAIVSASIMESLSLIALEALYVKKPVLLRATNPIAAFLQEQVETCFTFNNSKEFSEQLGQIIAKDWQKPPHAEQLDASQRWVDRSYSWKRITDIFDRELSPLKERSPV